MIAILYLILGIDFEIFDYQIQSRLRKFILIILVVVQSVRRLLFFNRLQLIAY